LITDYIGDEYGTNWKGYIGGFENVVIDSENIVRICNIVGGDQTHYCAINLIIPKKVRLNNGQIKDIVAIGGFDENQGFYNMDWVLEGNVTIPEGIQILDSGAFEFTSGLWSINIPNSIMTIKSDVFGEHLHTINLGNRTTQPTWTSDNQAIVFNNVSDTGNIIVSGSWTNKNDVLTFMQQWGLPSSGWTVNGQ
jgi:hypothetical protein